MAFALKMLVGPAVLLGLKAAKIDYDVPHNLLIIRILYAVSQLGLFAAMGVIYQRIIQDGDEEKTVQVKVPSPTGSTEEKLVTYKEYDMSEFQKLFKSFAMGAVMTIGIHVYMAVVPALLLQMVTQPMTLYDNALFSLYILKKDPSKDDKLKRPFPSDSPMAKFEVMKREMSEQEERAGLKKDDSQPVIEGAANSTGRQPVSRAERRPRPQRERCVDLDEE